ncbi:hypothetical protein DUT91_25015, partial [Phyllobacterium salinisoli]
VSVYARSDNSSVPIGEKDFGLTAAGSVPAGKVLSVISLDGDPLTANTPHLVQATYRTADGQSIGTQPVTWTIDPPVTGVSIGPSPTTTGADGKTVTSIEYTGSGTATATVKASAGTTPDIGTLQVDFAQTVSLPGTGTMQLAGPDNTQGLTEGTPYKLTCTYQDKNGNLVPANTRVLWYAAPSDKLAFSGGSGAQQGDPANTSYTQGATGQATINVTAQAGSNIADAVIGTTGIFNPAAGAYDHSDPDLVLGFANKSLQGIMLDKPFAHSALPKNDEVVPTDLTEVVAGRIALSGSGNASQPVRLIPTPGQAGLTVWQTTDLKTPLTLQYDGTQKQYYYSLT